MCLLSQLFLTPSEEPPGALSTLTEAVGSK
jgi:hypothetical protein